MSKTLNDVLTKEIDELYSMSDGDEKTQKIKNLVDLYEVNLKEVEHRNAESDAIAKERQTKIQNGIQIVKIVAETGISAATLVCTVACFSAGLKFEETGAIGSVWVKNLANRLTPGKKI